MKLARSSVIATPRASDSSRLEDILSSGRRIEKRGKEGERTGGRYVFAKRAAQVKEIAEFVGLFTHITTRAAPVGAAPCHCVLLRTRAVIVGGRRPPRFRDTVKRRSPRQPPAPASVCRDPSRIPMIQSGWIRTINLRRIVSWRSSTLDRASLVAPAFEIRPVPRASMDGDSMDVLVHSK